MSDKYRSYSRLSNSSKHSLSTRLASSLSPISAFNPGNTALAAPAPSLTVNNFVVFDIGNRHIRAGFAGDPIPRCEIPAEWAWDKVKNNNTVFFENTTVDKKTSENTESNFPQKSESLQDLEYQETSSFLKDLQTECIYWLWNYSTISLDNSFTLDSSLSNSKSDDNFKNTPNDGTNWDAQWYKTNHRKRLECVLESIIHYIFHQELIVDPKTQRVVVLENPLWPVAIKEVITSVLLRRLRCISVTFYPAPVLEMVAAGIRSGVVIDIGWEETIISPVYDLRLLSSKVLSTDRGAKMLYNEVKKVVLEKGIIITQEVIVSESSDSKASDTKKDEQASDAKRDDQSSDTKNDDLGPKKKRIRIRKRKVSESEITFNMIESIIKECLYEHKDSPLVTARTDNSRPYTYSGPFFASAPKSQDSPNFLESSRRSSSQFQQESDAASDSKAQEEQTVVHQYIKLSATKTLAVPNLPLRSCVSSTFLGISSVPASSTKPSLNKHKRRSSSYSQFSTTLSGVDAASGSSPSFDHRHDSSSLPLPTLISKLLTSLELDLRALLQSHLVFCGSPSRIPGLQAKLLQDVRRIVPRIDRYGTTSPLYISGTQSLGAWTGASVYLEALSWYFVNEGVDGADTYRAQQDGNYVQSQNPDLVGDGGNGLDPLGQTVPNAAGARTKLPGEITKEAYLTFGFYRLNVPYGVVV